MTRNRTIAIGALAALALLPAAAAARPAPVALELLGRTPALGEGGAEIAAYAPAAKRIFATDAAANTLDIYDASTPAAPVPAGSIDLAPYGGGPNSVDVSGTTSSLSRSRRTWSPILAPSSSSPPAGSTSRASPPGRCRTW